MWLVKNVKLLVVLAFAGKIANFLFNDKKARERFVPGIGPYIGWDAIFARKQNRRRYDCYVDGIRPRS